MRTAGVGAGGGAGQEQQGGRGRRPAALWVQTMGRGGTGRGGGRS